MFVPMDVIAGFRGIQRLTMEQSLIEEALKESKTLVIDSSGPFLRIRPNVTSERSTLILREIPQATPEDEVKALFGEHVSELATIRSEIGNNWYCNFNGEAAAMAALEHLQSQTFNGNMVRARIKSESIIRSFYAQQEGGKGGAAPAPQYGGYKGGKGMPGGYRQGQMYFDQGKGKGGYYPQYQYVQQFQPYGQGYGPDNATVLPMPNSVGVQG